VLAIVSLHPFISLSHCDVEHPINLFEAVIFFRLPLLFPRSSEALPGSSLYLPDAAP
jgi:hypothetical protein